MPRIAAMKSSLTGAERKVADYVLAHPREVVGCSITELAERCEVGDTSVFRFCKSLQFTGFTEFKLAVALCLSDDEVSGLVLDSEITLEDDLTGIASKLLTSHTQALYNTRALLREDQLDRAVKALLEAKRIVAVGAGASLVLAMNAYTRFVRITPDMRCAPDSHSQAIEAAHCGPNSVLLAFSHSGLTLDIVRCAQLARQNGATVIAVTGQLRTPLTDSADIVLLCGSVHSDLQYASAIASVTSNYILEILYTEYFRRAYRDSLDTLDRTTASVTDKLL